MILAPFAAWLGKSALMQSPLGGILGRYWKPLLVALVLAIGFLWHGHKVAQLRADAFKAGYAQAVDNGKKNAARVERKSAAITNDVRSKTDEKMRDSARHADDLRLRGPGRAVCPQLSGPASGHDPASRGANGGLAGLPDEERDRIVALPFDETVERAKVADANRLEVLAWREWHQRLTDEWAKWKADADAAPHR